MKRLHNPWPFASIGLAAIGIGSAAPILLPDFFAETPIPALAVPYVKLGAVILIIFGSIGVLLAILTWCLRPLSDTATFLLLTRGRYGYFVAQAGIDDLDDLYVHYVDLFG